MTVDPHRTMITSVRVVGENWANIDDPVERRRAQNRIAQRGYRKRLKKEKGALNGASATAKVSGEEHDQQQPLPTPTTFHHHHQQQQPQPQPQPPIPLQTPPEFRLFSPPPMDGLSFPDSWTPTPIDDSHRSYSPAEETFALTTANNPHHHRYDYDLSNPHDTSFPLSAVHPADLSRPQSQPIHTPTPSVTSNPSPSSVVDHIPLPTTPPVGSSPGNTALHRAALYGHESVLGVLLRAGADASIADSAGLTPLHLAAMKGHARLVTLLLESPAGSGVDVNGLTREGETPLHLAVKFHQPAVVRALLQPNCHQELRVDAQDWWGRTALHLACERNHRDLVEMLLQAGAQLEIRDLEGQTPLHTACLGEGM